MGPKVQKNKANREFRKILDYKEVNGYIRFEVERMSGLKRYVEASAFQSEEDIDLLENFKMAQTKQEYQSGEFRLEKIIRHRKIGDTNYYLAMWEGSPHPLWHTEFTERQLLSAGYHVLLEDYKSRLEAETKLRAARSSRVDPNLDEETDEDMDRPGDDVFGIDAEPSTSTPPPRNAPDALPSPQKSVPAPEQQGAPDQAPALHKSFSAPSPQGRARAQRAASAPPSAPTPTHQSNAAGPSELSAQAITSAVAQEVFETHAKIQARDIEKKQRKREFEADQLERNLLQIAGKKALEWRRQNLREDEQ